MKRHELLAHLHHDYRPRTYLEIGINTGRSLSLSRTTTIAVDPDFRIKTEINCDVQVLKMTSDDFFARDDPLAHFSNRRVDLAFIDGLHLFEYALRDFINVERHSDWTSVIVLDDVLPREAIQASRRQESTLWTGDVFKLSEILRAHRPGLLLWEVDTDPTGVLLIFGADPSSGILAERYDEIVRGYSHPDPQTVGEEILCRQRAVDPQSIAGAGFWRSLIDARERGVARTEGWTELRAALEASVRPAGRRLPPSGVQPLRRAATVRTGSAEDGRSPFARVRSRLRPLRKHLLTFRAR
jgi:hypothetical protein